jgi:hypothetical protein
MQSFDEQDWAAMPFYNALHGYLGMVGCPNCQRPFNAMGSAAGQYCPECWSSWCRNDASFEARARSKAKAQIRAYQEVKE